MEVQYRKLNESNFNQDTLDGFIRHQEVKECWRKNGGEWKLVPNAFEENWPLQECREIAENVARHMNGDQTAFGAFDGGKLVGFITVSHRIFGSTARYVELVCFQVSEPCRNQGIGKRLFALACQEAVRLGAEKLYISAHSSKETQAAYRALGCTLASEINETLAAAEPCDVQLEYVLPTPAERNVP